MSSSSGSSGELANQFGTFIGGGPEHCFLRDEGPLPYAHLIWRPVVGAKVSLCMAGFSPDAVRLEVRTPAGRTVASTVETSNDPDVIFETGPNPMNGSTRLAATVVDEARGVALRQTTLWFIDSDVEEGSYLFVLRQGPREARFGAEVGLSDMPEIRAVHDGPKAGQLTFALYGYAANEKVPVGLYRFTGRSGNDGNEFTRVLELSVRVGPRGFALFVVDPLALGLPANPNRIDYLDYCAIPKGVDPGASNVQCAIGTGGTPTSGFSGPPDPGFWR